MDLEATPHPQLVDPWEGGHVAGALVLLNRELGEGMYSWPRLRAAAAGPGSALHAIVEEGEVVAAAVTRLLDREDASYYDRFGPLAMDLFKRYRVGSLEALAVEPARRRRGLGRALALERMAWIREQGGGVAVGLAWLSGRADSSEPLYRSLGFVIGPPVREFYLEESRRDGWACPACGGPCRCSAAFFYKLLP